MGLRLEVLLYAQLLGMVFFALQLEANVVFSRSTDQVQAAEKLKNFFSHGVSAPGGFVSYYVGFLIGLMTLINLKRVYTNRSPLDFFSVSLGLAASLWFNSKYISQERILAYLEPEEVIQHIAKMTISTAIAGFFLFSMIFLSLLSSPINFLWDPIELIFLHLLGGMVVYDLSFDFGFLVNSPLEEHFLHVTGVSGSQLVDSIVPALLVFIIVFVLFRLVYQYQYENFISLFIFVVGAVLFHYYVEPIEKTLSESDSPSYESQKMIVYSHCLFAILIIFETTFKWTLYCLKLSPPETLGLVKDVPPVLKLEGPKTITKETTTKEKNKKKNK